MSDRLPTHVEVGAIVRRAQANGDFATILRRGDQERGSLLLVIESRGRHFGCLERILNLDGAYEWQATGPSESAEPPEVSSFLGKRARFDEDLWIIELDVAAPERFTAEKVTRS